MKAWIENGVVRDVCHGIPEELYHPDIAALYNTDVPDGAANGDSWIDDELIKKVIPEPEPYVPPPEPEPVPDPAEWLIDVGPFFDRFGASKMAILVSQDVSVRAVIQDVMVRKWVDLQRADVALAIDLLVSKGIAGVTSAIKTAVLTTPVDLMENMALRKLYFS